MPDYGGVDYWDHRYALDTGASFDWLQTYEGLKHIITKFITPESEVLNLGCGNSRLAEELHDDGFRFITNIDLSPVCIKQMNERYADKPDMEFSVMDTTKLDFPDGCFNLVFDKGTIDTLMCGEDSFRNVVMTLKEAYRVLKPGGTFMCISYGMPASRLPHLEARSLDWNVEYTTVTKPEVEHKAMDPPPGASTVHYVYLCTKPYQA